MGSTSGPRAAPKAAPKDDQRDHVRTIRAAVNATIGQVGAGLYGVACSGGVDSMALADAVIAVAGATNVVIVTIDHGLVPRSAQVADGVAAWAREQGATAIVRRVSVARDGSLEAAARAARYAAFETAIVGLGLAALMLAHTHRDQAETVLMRIIRGTGPAGLVGIPARRGPYVRPLLELRRVATEAYVAERALPTWDDPMNADPDITRVRVRDIVLPAIRAENPSVDEALVRLAASTREWLDVIDRDAAPLGQFPIACPALARHPAAIRKRALALALDRAGIDFDATHLEALDVLVLAPDRGEVGIDVPGARIIRSYATLTVADVRHPAGSGISSSDDYEVRTWQAGDRMCPVRLRGRSRKLSDLFIDLKLPRAKRATAQVMVRRSDRTIVWVEHIGPAFGESSDLPRLPR
ncbi:MAG TPA: tRNA lysidine(34) synthetase TilS [Kofleriaceae bacterium]